MVGIAKNRGKNRLKWKRRKEGSRQARRMEDRRKEGRRKEGKKEERKKEILTWTRSSIARSGILGLAITWLDYVGGLHADSGTILTTTTTLLATNTICSPLSPCRTWKAKIMNINSFILTLLSHFLFLSFLAFLPSLFFFRPWNLSFKRYDPCRLSQPNHRSVNEQLTIEKYSKWAPMTVDIPGGG